MQMSPTLQRLIDKDPKTKAFFDMLEKAKVRYSWEPTE